MVFEVVEINYNIDERTGLISNQTIVSTGVKSAKLYPSPLRMVVCRDIEKDISLTFITNNFKLAALETYLGVDLRCNFIIFVGLKNT